MRLMKIVLFMGFLIGNVRSTEAQTDNPTYNLPAVIPPPADAAALGKYGSTPVDMSTGAANISIPLYEIKTPRLSLPISLNYNATGIKVDDIASWVGLEWSLNAGGLITRSIRGTDDFGGGGYYTTTVPADSNIVPQEAWSFFEHYMLHEQDAEPDYFFYNFSGYSGKFFYGTNKLPEIVNYQQPVQIQFNYGPQTFSILDEKGNTYYFGVLENNASSGDYSNNKNPTAYISSWYLSKIVSFDKSDSIVFTYYQDAKLEQDFQTYTETIGPYYTSTTSLFSYNTVGHTTGTGEPFIRSYPWRLKEIDYKNGKVVLFSSATRSDGISAKLDSIIAYNYDYTLHQYDLVKKIVPYYDYYLTTQNYQPAISTNPYRLRLDSVGIYGVNKLYGGDYKFTYNSAMLPWINSNGRDLFGYYNGNISNATLIPTQTTTFNSTVYNVGSANRATDTTAIQAGILQSMTYPTGGQTNFYYESNSYNAAGSLTNVTMGTANAAGTHVETDTVDFVAPNNVYGNIAYVFIKISPYSYTGVDTIPFAEITDLTTGQVLFSQFYSDPNNGASPFQQIGIVSGHTYQCIAAAFDDPRVTSQIYVTLQEVTGALSSVYGGGLRIRQSTDYDMNGRFLQSNLYKYGLGECGYGFLAAPISLFNTNSYTMNFAYFDMTGNPGFTGGVNVADVPEYQTSREAFLGACVYDAFSLSGAPVSYQAVTKYRVDSLNNNVGKSIFYYNYYQDQVVGASVNYLDGYYITNAGWASGQLLLDEEYAANAGIYWPIKRTYYSYVDSGQPQGRGLKIGFKYVYPQNPPMDSIDMLSNFNTVYYWFDVPTNAGSELLTMQTTYDYSQLDTTKYVITARKFSYDNLTHLQPTKIVESRSDGTALTTINRYPAEIDSISGLTSGQMAAIDTLEARHNITTLIQTQNLVDSMPVSLTRYDYNVIGGGMDLVDSIQTQVSSNPMETRAFFNSYDNFGNTLCDWKSSDLMHCYLWDYGNAYPIAEVINASQSDIAYTSFEADGSGNWTVPDTTRNRTLGGITGNQSYNLTSTNSITKSGLNAATTYIISYWGDTGSTAKVNSASGIPKIVLGSWTYYEDTVKGTTTITISGTGLIDELRLYPKGSLMTTYTYSPLIGITSKCGPSSRLIYYTYDGLGRLKLIKDQYGNILKRYDYEYQTTNQ